MKTRKNYRYLWAAMIVAILCMMISVPSFAADKALRYKVNFGGKTFEDMYSEESEQCSYDFGVFNTASFKVAKNVELSGDLLIPVKLFKNKNSYLQISANFGVFSNEAEGYEYLAGIDNTRIFTLTKDGKVTCFNNLTEKNENAGKYCTVKKTSEYLIVHFSDKLNIEKNEIFNGSQDMFENRKINPAIYVMVTGNGMKSGFIFLDNIKIKSGSKSVEVTFDKKDFRDYSYMWRGDWVGEMHPLNSKIVKRPA